MRYKSMINLLTSILVIYLVAPSAYAESDPSQHWGLELQAYPTGVITGLRYEWQTGEQDVIFARLAYNITERSDFGEHDDESGGGPGVGIGWRHWKDQMGKEWHYGARLDIWDLNIDWEEDGPPKEKGDTDIIVVQPSAELGYSWPQADGSRVDLTAGLGVEINVDTEGEDVGEGIIALFGVTWMFR
jgi:hypothetical protein